MAAGRRRELAEIVEGQIRQRVELEVAPDVLHRIELGRVGREELGDELGAPLSAICFEGSEDRINRTDVSQPALYACGVACWAGLHEQTPGLEIATVAALYMPRAYTGSSSRSPSAF